MVVHHKGVKQMTEETKEPGSAKDAARPIAKQNMKSRPVKPRRPRRQVVPPTNDWHTGPTENAGPLAEDLKLCQRYAFEIQRELDMLQGMRPSRSGRIEPVYFATVQQLCLHLAKETDRLCRKYGLAHYRFVAKVEETFRS
jgi:hypothetical protein